MEITCYRDTEIKRESHFLPASTYNLARQLLTRCADDYLFVPIRSMQYLAILDKEEFVFIDGQRKCWIDVAWQNFHSQDRTHLAQPVAYEVVYYGENQADIMLRLQKEFPKALQLIADKQIPRTPARVIKFPVVQS
jgi:hypothetical protein